MLKLENIVKQYPLPSGEDGITVLNGVNLEVAAGESIAVVGPSGSGKSTLLNIIGTLDKPTSGKIEINNTDINSLNTNDLAELRNKNIGFVFQQHHLLPQLTVLENVLVPTIPAAEEDATGRARDLLARVGLQNQLDYRPAQLSGGEQQRVAVVRALINKPQLLLADEPTGSLDQKNSDLMGEILLRLNREEHATLIMVTHSIELANKMQRIYRLKDGLLTVA